MNKPLLQPTDMRHWWWSPKPFWEYLVIDFSGNTQGWANMVDRHPGCFNLAWLMSGASRPPSDYQSTARLTQWAFTDAHLLPMANRTMADWALDLSMEDFRYVFDQDYPQLERWNFRGHCSLQEIRAALDQRLKKRARL